MFRCYENIRLGGVVQETQTLISYARAYRLAYLRLFYNRKMGALLLFGSRKLTVQFEMNFAICLKHNLAQSEALA